jgi:enoyl-CoA hydratase
MPYQNLLTQKKARILYITINRENKLNALNVQMLEELSLVLTDGMNDEEVRGIIITGAGEKAFIAGADIKEFSSYSVEEGRQLAEEGQNKVFNVIQNSSKPIAAAINGYALGGGLELALACHIRIASNTAWLGLPEVTLGLIPGYGGTQRLAQLVGRGRALEMILTGEMINASDALNYGLVNHVVLPDELLKKADEIMLKIISRSSLAIASAIKAINAGFLLNGYEEEIDQFAKCFGTADFKEGVSAFLEKRKPHFK